MNKFQFELKKASWGAAWFLIILYVLFLNFIIFKTAVNVPFMDDWEIFGSNGIQNGWNLNYLLGWQNEHRAVATKLLFLINLKVFDLNFSDQILINFYIYLIFLLCVWKFIGGRIASGKSFLAMIALLPFITNLASEIHTWAFPVHFLIGLFSFFLGTYFLFCKDKWLFFLVTMALWSVSIFNFSGTIGAILVACLVFSIKSIFFKERHGLLKSLFAFLILGILIILWAKGFHRNPAHPAFSYPWHFQFWRFYAELISLGFGFTSTNALFSGLSILLVSIPLFLAALSVSIERNSDPFRWFLLGLTMGILAMLGLIAFGRAGLPLQFAKSSRYSIFACLLPLLSVSLFLVGYPKYKVGAIIVCIFLIFGIYDNFGFSEYKSISQKRRQGRNCVLKILKENDKDKPNLCPEVYPAPLSEKIETAKLLGVSFTKF